MIFRRKIGGAGLEEIGKNGRIINVEKKNPTTSQFDVCSKAPQDWDMRRSRHFMQKKKKQ